MNISVDFIGIDEMQETKKYNMSRLAFIKHLAIAEQGYLPSLHKLIRTLSRFVLFSPFLKKEAFRDNRFSEPNFFYNDNEPKRLFPSLAGLAFADYLSKRIDKSIFSISFDALHSNSPRSQRVLDPDLLCFSNQFVFGIESKFKNYSRNSRNWSAPQNQIDLNLLNINYLVFAVTYNVYNQVQCNYYSTWSRDFNYDDNILRKISAMYYNGFLEFLNNENFERQVTHIQNEDFYAINLLSDRNLFDAECFQFVCPLKLILLIQIHEYAEQGISKETKPFVFIPSKDEEEKIYIDYDRIGLSML